MEPQPRLEQILDEEILMSMVYKRSFGERIMMNFLAIEAFNTVNQPQTKTMSPGGQYRSIWTILKIFGIMGNMMILTMVMLKH